MKTHELKIWPKYFKPVFDREKTFEVRKNDRDFHFGDRVVLEEYDPERPYRDSSLKQLDEPRGYTGKWVEFRIGYILDIGDNTVVFSLMEL